MNYKFLILLLAGFALVACNSEPSPSAPQSSPPSEGPSVIGIDVDIVDWSYLGPDVDGSRQSFQALPAGVQQFGESPHEVWLLTTEDGIELEWMELPCATRPVAVLQADGSIDFWPGETVGEVCEAMGVGHRITVELAEGRPQAAWMVIYHPRPTLAR